MREQQQLARPFGIEGLQAGLHLRMGHGWEWVVKEYTGSGWAILDSGLSSSWQKAARAMAACLDYVAAGEPF